MSIEGLVIGSRWYGWRLTLGLTLELKAHGSASRSVPRDQARACLGSGVLQPYDELWTCQPKADIGLKSNLAMTKTQPLQKAHLIQSNLPLHNLEGNISG
jgi:hypothetical protein